MSTNEEIMAELRKIRQEQENYAQLIVSIQLTNIFGGKDSVDKIMQRTNKLIAEQRVQ